jgi:hypothetical protein
MTAMDIDGQRAEVWFADDGCNEAAENIFHKRANDGIESTADDYGYCEIDNIATENKIPESFEHAVLP